MAPRLRVEVGSHPRANSTNPLGNSATPARIVTVCHSEHGCAAGIDALQRPAWGLPPILPRLPLSRYDTADDHSVYDRNPQNGVPCDEYNTMVVSNNNLHGTKLQARLRPAPSAHWHHPSCPPRKRLGSVVNKIPPAIQVTECPVRRPYDTATSPRSSLHRGCAHVPQNSVLFPQAITRSQAHVVDCEMSVVAQA